MVIPPHVETKSTYHLQLLPWCSSIQPRMTPVTLMPQALSVCRQRNLMWVVISSCSIPAARIRFRWSSRRMQEGSALSTRPAKHPITAA